MTIVVKPLSEQIYALIRDRVISGDLPVEAAIRQDALAKELGVSKIPLREAFARLESDGLLFSVANRGYFVPSMSVDEAEEVYALRLKIEPDAVAVAAKLANEDERRHTLETLQALDDVEVRDRVASGKHHRTFHMALVRPSRQKTTIQIAERLHAVAERYVNKHLEPVGREKRAKREHTAMYEAWAEGRDKLVKTLMYEHLASTLDDLRQQFEIEKAAQ